MKYRLPKPGEKKGLLTVLDFWYDESGIRPRGMVKCKCECGNVIDVKLGRWNQYCSNKHVSCGCYIKHKNSKNVPNIGDRFGRLVVTDNSLHVGNLKACKCHCDCGKDIIVKMWYLHGTMKSCGCLKQERLEKSRLRVGDKFGMLTVERVYIKDHVGWCDCRCDCGSVISISQCILKSGHKYSCGCVRGNSKHGESRTRLYRIWKGMRDRCKNSSSYYYKWYGARGISVCSDWDSNYELFRDWSITHGYCDNLSIDRIDSDGDYTPENCKWSTVLEQNRNKRTTPMIEYKGCKRLRSDWEKELGLSSGCIGRRIRNGWTIEEAIETPNTVKRGWRNRNG